MSAFSLLYPLCRGQPCWPFRGCILCAVVNHAGFCCSNRSCCLVNDSCCGYILFCLPPIKVSALLLTPDIQPVALTYISWLYPFLQRTVAGKCSGIVLHTARSVSADFFSGKGKTSCRDPLCAARHKSCSIGVCCATSQLPRWKQRRDITMLAFSWLYPSCLPPIKVDALLLER